MSQHRSCLLAGLCNNTGMGSRGREEGKSIISTNIRTHTHTHTHHTHSLYRYMHTIGSFEMEASFSFFSNKQGKPRAVLNTDPTLWRPPCGGTHCTTHAHTRHTRHLLRVMDSAASCLTTHTEGTRFKGPRSKTSFLFCKHFEDVVKIQVEHSLSLTT